MYSYNDSYLTCFRDWKHWLVLEFKDAGIVPYTIFYHCTVVLWKQGFGQSTLHVCKKRVGTLLCVSTFNHERAPMSCLQQADSLEANTWANNEQQNHQWLQSYAWQYTTLWTAPCHPDLGNVALVLTRDLSGQLYYKLTCKTRKTLCNTSR